MNGNDLVTVKYVKIAASTDKAYGCLINDPDDPEDQEVKFWIPKSQIDTERKQKDGLWELDIPRWLAEKNELEYEDD